MNRIVLVLCLLCTVKAQFSIDSEARCEPIRVPMCQNLEYNQTTMPNQFKHQSQDEAAMEVHQFWALVEINCAAELKFFLCSMYTPICLPSYQKPIKACRSVCTRARMGCEKYMRKFGFEWPEHMNCNLFPEYGSDTEVCMDPMDAYKHTSDTLQINTDLKQQTKIAQQTQSTVGIMTTKTSTKYGKLPSIKPAGCPSPFITLLPDNVNYNQLSTGSIPNCVQPCHSVYFEHKEREFVNHWILFWASICLFSSLCTTVTYLIDTSRFKYPEKPIIYLSICYLFISIGYLLKFVNFDHKQMACESNGSIRYNLNTSSSSIPCTISFVLIYYFGMASSVWWIIISLTWFLAAGLKWGSEVISRYNVHFHTVAWLLPFIQTCTILAMSLVDADPLTGLCYVGNLSTHNLRMFVIAPAVCYLLIGITFLFAGFVALFRIRTLIKHQQAGDSVRRTQKLEKLMLRIGVFSILYTVPASCVIACQFYEQHFRADWERNALCKSRTGQACDPGQLENGMFGIQPVFSAFVLKYLMGLIIGVTSGFWIWTSKTVRTWKRFLRQVFCCQSNDKTSKKQLRNKTTKKNNSIIYFQANDDLENNPHKQFYDVSSASSGGAERAPLKGTNKDNNTCASNSPSKNSSGIGSSYKNPDSVVSLQFNSTSNTVSTGIAFYPPVNNTVPIQHAFEITQPIYQQHLPAADLLRYQLSEPGDQCFSGYPSLNV